MKTILFTIFSMAIMSVASSQLRMPQPSPTQYIKQDFGLASIELTYARPSAKGRTMIGNVEPWNVVWRTGANAATKIRFNEPVEILGNKIDTGNYAIYTIPQKNGDWTFILNKGISNWGADGYKESDDVMRAQVKATKNASKVETFTMQFSDIKPESITLNIKWEDFALKIPITTNIKDKLRASVEAALKSDNKPYWQAAQFYADWDNNKKRALELVNEAVGQSSNPPFYMVHYKAKLQSDLGDKKGALASAKQSLELSKTAKNNAYIQLNEKLISELNK